MKRLEPIRSKDDTIMPSEHLQDLASQEHTIFILDAEGRPEVWLGNRLWEVAARDGHKPGDCVDPPGGPVVRIMAAQDEAYLVAHLGGEA